MVVMDIWSEQSLGNRSRAVPLAPWSLCISWGPLFLFKDLSPRKNHSNDHLSFRGRGFLFRNYSLIIPLFCTYPWPERFHTHATSRSPLGNRVCPWWEIHRCLEGCLLWMVLGLIYLNDWLRDVRDPREWCPKHVSLNDGHDPKNASWWTYDPKGFGAPISLDTPI